MNWTVVRLIAGREIRDLLRDRRSIILLVILPVVLYPLFGLVFFYFAISMVEHVSKVGVVGLEHLSGPIIPSRMAGAWWAAAPSDFAASGLASSEAVRFAGNLVEPPLVSEGRFALRYFGSRKEQDVLPIVPLMSADRAPLDSKAVDVLMIIPEDLQAQLKTDVQTTIKLLIREGDESSKLAERRVQDMLERYKSAVRYARFIRHGLPMNFDDPINVHSPRDDDTKLQQTTEELRERLSHFFPFLLVMWALAGALHPAIDVCAGEKERGTMETLLLSPAERSEVVAGKLVAVTGFSLGTAIWNLVWMSGLCILGSWFFESAFLRLPSLIWCVVLAIPLAALFSALSLALGVFARSTKEGQYYLLPLFLGVLPFVLLSMMPHLELTWATALIPITGTCLVLSKLLGPAAEPGVLWYLIPVVISMVVCVLAAGAWAVAQFHREDVLFREGVGSQN